MKTTNIPENLITSRKMQGTKISLSNNVLSDLIIQSASQKGKRKQISADLQVLSIAPEGISAIISDGYLKEKAVFFKNAKASMTNESTRLEKLDVISCSLVFHNSTLIMLSYTKRATKATKVIGNPIEKSTYEANGNSFADGATNVLIPKNRPVQQRQGPIAQKRVSTLDPKSLSEDDYVPVKNLTKNSRSWIIKCRLDSKAPIRTYKSRKTGDLGKVLNVVFRDTSGEIGATLWNEDVDKYAGMLQVGKLFVVSNCMLKDSGRYSNTGHPLEMTFSRKTKITETTDSDVPANPKIQFSKLGDIVNKNPGNIVSMSVIVYSDPETNEYTKKDSDEKISKVGFKAIDDSKVVVNFNYWKNQNNSNFLDKLKKDQPVIIYKGIVREFSGNKFVLIGSNSQLYCPLDKDSLHKDSMMEMNSLRKWFASGSMDTSNLKDLTGSSKTTANLSTLQQVKNETCQKFNIPDIRAEPDSSTEDVKAFFNCLVRVKAFTGKRKTWRKNIDGEERSGFFGQILITDPYGSIWSNFSDKPGKLFFNDMPALEFRELEDTKEQEGEDEGYATQKINSMINQVKGRSIYAKIMAKYNEYSGKSSVKFFVTNCWYYNQGQDWDKLNRSLISQLNGVLE